MSKRPIFRDAPANDANGMSTYPTVNTYPLPSESLGPCSCTACRPLADLCSELTHAFASKIRDQGGTVGERLLVAKATAFLGSLA